MLNSRAVLCNGGVAQALSKDHKVETDGPDADRIRKAGGWISQGRLCGLLNISRSFGDLEFKGGQAVPRGGSFGDLEFKGATLVGAATCAESFSADLLTADPELCVVPLLPTHEFLVMGCDGVFDVVSSQEAVNCVRESLHVSGGDVAVAANVLVKKALRYGTTDNVTVVVVALRHGD